MSDYSDYEDDVIDSPQSMTPGMSEDPKRHARAQHNALERRRRDNIKDMYSALREAVPEMNNERASRAVILKKTIDAIDLRTKRNISLSEEKKRIDEENRVLQEEIAKLEREIQDTVSNNRLSSDVPSPLGTPTLTFKNSVTPK